MPPFIESAAPSTIPTKAPSVLASFDPVCNASTVTINVQFSYTSQNDTNDILIQNILLNITRKAMTDIELRCIVETYSLQTNQLQLNGIINMTLYLCTKCDENTDLFASDSVINEIKGDIIKIDTPILTVIHNSTIIVSITINKPALSEKEGEEHGVETTKYIQTAYNPANSNDDELIWMVVSFIGGLIISCTCAGVALLVCIRISKHKKAAQDDKLNLENVVNHDLRQPAEFSIDANIRVKAIKSLSSIKEEGTKHVQDNENNVQGVNDNKVVNKPQNTMSDGNLFTAGFDDNTNNMQRDSRCEGVKFSARSRSNSLQQDNSNFEIIYSQETDVGSDDQRSQLHHDTVYIGK